MVVGRGGCWILDKVAQGMDWTQHTYQIAVYGYMTFGNVQDLFRIGYALIRKKGMASFSLMGALVDSIYIPWQYIKKKKGLS